MDSNFSKKGYTSTMHSFPFINDGPKVTNSPTATQQYSSNNNTDIRVPPGVIHIKPAWKPVKLDEKPPFSYATIIAHAILSSEYRKLTLSEIYQWISKQYPCYSMKDHRWQNSIRHNLSLQKAFAKLERNTLAVGKGSYWTIVPGYEQHFIDNLVKKGCGGSARGLSAISDHDKQPNNNSQTTHKQFKKLMLDSTTDKKTNHSHLFTIFRMNPTTSNTTKDEEERSSAKRKKTNKGVRSFKAPKKTTVAPPTMPTTTTTTTTTSTTRESGGYDSDCDSGIDLNCYPTNEIKKEPISPYFIEYSSTSSLLTPASDNSSAATEEEEEEKAYFDHFATLFPQPLDCMYANTEAMAYWPTTNYTTTLEESSNYFDTTNLIDSSFDASNNYSVVSSSSTSTDNFFLNTYPPVESSPFFFL